VAFLPLDLGVLILIPLPVTHKKDDKSDRVLKLQIDILDAADHVSLLSSLNKFIKFTSVNQ
jgi:hypothetical protein